MSRVALVTGGNRGIGLAVVKGLAQLGKTNSIGTLIFTSTNEEVGKQVLSDLKSEYTEGPSMHYHVLQATDRKSVEKLIEDVNKEFGGVDILVNNAGILEKQYVKTSLFEINREDFDKSVEINSWTPLALIQGFIGGMKSKGFGRIVNMSSGAGALTGMNSGMPPYRLSKTMLNVWTRIASDELKEEYPNIKINSMCPGFIKTDMTAHFERQPTLTPKDGADTALFLATLPEDGASGNFYRFKEEIPW
jgi:NAD(P)-dependent dehydrogenase (short-subunit alcohol dehydrogenase family)